MTTLFSKILFRLFGIQIIHSQLGEDLILSLLLEGKKDGFYVDIGANNPKKFNNTYMLYKSGWHGINIEPNPKKIAAFKRQRSRDVNLAIGVGPKEGAMKYYRFDEDTLNTFDYAFAEKNKNMGHKLQDVIDVPVKPLSVIFKDIAHAIDVMTLDTEGYDMEVLKSNDWNKYRPHFIVIETLEYKRTELGQRYDDIFNPYMKSIGYMPVANTVVNYHLPGREMKKLKPFIKKSLRIALTPFVIGDYRRFKKAAAKMEAAANQKPRFKLSLRDAHPQIKDKTMTTGFDRHYVYHTAWAIRKVRDLNPKKHVDISSSLYFCTHISAFIPTEFYDYRPAELSGLDGLKSLKGDLMKLPFADGSVESISCLHTIEHVGLGRYGDPIDPNGDIKAVEELKRVVARGGSLLFVTPVGKPVIEFNAHRIYSYAQIIDMFTKGPNALKLKEFSLIRESEGGLITHASPQTADAEHYACGCFWFVK